MMAAAAPRGGGGNFGQPPPPRPQQFHPRQDRQDPRMMFQQQQQQHQQPPPPQQQMDQGQSPPINFRVILNRDEVAFLFGFDGVLLGQLRQQTGANLLLTDPKGGHEQVLTIAGPLEMIFKAFSLICRKLWDFLQSLGGQQQLLIRLAVPGSQCGSIIGKHGIKVKEIRDMTGANIQVSQESLPDSTERCVEVSGTGESCLQCAYHICGILQDSQIRGHHVPYVPKGPGGVMGPPVPPAMDDRYKPVFLCGDKAFVIEGNFAVPAPPELLRRELAQTPLGDMAESLALLKQNQQQQQQQQQQPQQQQQQQTPDHMNPLSLMQAISSAQRNQGSSQPQTSREMTLPAGLVAALVARNKLAEIRRISGAHVHVDEDGPPDAKGEKVVTLSGTKESILLAQFLVQSNVDMAAKDGGGGGNSEGNNQGPGGPGGPVGPGGPGGPPQRENGPPPGQQQSHNRQQQNDPRLRGFRGRGGGRGGGRS